MLRTHRGNSHSQMLRSQTLPDDPDGSKYTPMELGSSSPPADPILTHGHGEESGQSVPHGGPPQNHGCAAHTTCGAASCGQRAAVQGFARPARSPAAPASAQATPPGAWAEAAAAQPRRGQTLGSSASPQTAKRKASSDIGTNGQASPHSLSSPPTPSVVTCAAHHPLSQLTSSQLVLSARLHVSLPFSLPYPRSACAGG